jgi:hypothetical protein
VLSRSPADARYDQPLDRESAREMLAAQAEARATEADRKRR